MLPPPARSIAGIACLQPKNTPFRFTRITRSQVSSFVSRTEPSAGGKMPALLKRTSSLPHAFSAAATIPSASLSSETSACTNRAFPPAAPISSATPRPAASLTSATTTRAPSRANRSADSRPMPPPAPVMTATLSSSLPISASLEEARPFPARDHLVELALLGPQEMEVMRDDLLAERLPRHPARLEERDRLAQAPRDPRQLARRVDVPLEGRRRLDAPGHPGESP